MRCNVFKSEKTWIKEKLEISFCFIFSIILEKSDIYEVLGQTET